MTKQRALKRTQGLVSGNVVSLMTKADSIEMGERLKALLPMFRVKLPYAPTTNHLFAHGLVGGKVRRFPSKVYKAWRQEAVLLMRARHHRPPLEGPLSLYIVLTPPDRRKRDASNSIKPIEDALVDARIVGDDSQFMHIIVDMRDPDASTAGAVVEVSEYFAPAA